MKKIIPLLAIITLLLTGCGEKLDNTPTKQVEGLLSKYQTLDKDVLTQLDETVSEENKFDANQRDRYKTIMKKHYQNLVYTIKDEVINGDDATVTVEIQVTDYSKVMNAADLELTTNPTQFNDDTDVYSESKFMDYRLDKMESAADKVKYTMDFTLTKVDDKWVLNDLTEIDRNKIHGIYVY